MPTNDLKILVDETNDGMDEELQKLGYVAESVKKLRLKDVKMAHDYNVIQYAKENNMILITKDKEPAKACQANDIPCIWINDKSIFERIVLKELEKYKNT